MHTVAETAIFPREADALPSPQERMELIALLARSPLAGDVISGDVRKLRFAAGGEGRRGAFRVIYYVLADELPVMAITLYGRNEKCDPTPAELDGARRIVNAMKAQLRQQLATG